MDCFRVVSKSTFAFETDLPCSLHNIHPSGIVHAFRSTPPEPDAFGSSNLSHISREEHTFAWITNSLHTESAVAHLEKNGFDRIKEIVFIPYSTKRNWLDRYPHAEPAIECTDDGKCIAFMDRRPHPNGLKSLGAMADGDGDAFCVVDVASMNENCNGDSKDDCENGNGATATASEAIKNKEKKKRIYPRALNMVRDNSFIHDAERDELHIEIYNYLSWLHAKLVEVERNSEPTAPKRHRRKSRGTPLTYVPPDSGVEITSVRRQNEGGRRLCKVVDCSAQSQHYRCDGFCRRHFAQFAISTGDEGCDADPPSPESDDDKEDADDQDEEKRMDEDDQEKKKEVQRPLLKNIGINVLELQGVLDKLESSFSIIHNANTEAAAEAKVRQQQQQREDFQQNEEAAERQQPQKQWQTQPTATAQASQKRAPFLERALSKELSQLVSARIESGKSKRRSRKRKRQYLTAPDSGRRTRPLANDFDEVFEKLVRYKEEHGDTIVWKEYQDQQLANWVRGIRERMAKIAKLGMEVEEIPSGQPIRAKSLTAERVKRLNSIGFAWVVGPSRTPWQERFDELMQYYEANGRWPSQSMGSLGNWVSKQRGAYARKDVSYMKDKAPKLDEVGFEWTPRGYTRMDWDEGLELLMEYGRINGNFDVPRPINESQATDRHSEELRLHLWVRSLHRMYRSYKLGRKSGSLTDERVLLLVKHGFTFREDYE